MDKYTKNYFGGGLMFVIGIAALWRSMSYQIGTLNNMGSGFFPAALGAILALTGVAIAVTARLATPRGEAKRLPPEWRGWACISLGIVAFAVLGQYAGLLPAAFAIVFISALGDRRNTLRSALLLALAISVVCVVVFWWALKLQLPLWQWQWR